MEKILTWNFGENFIENLSEFLLKNFVKENRDLSRVACVFGGKRPALFLRRQLARKIKKPFYPPRTFSIDEFVEYTISGDSPLLKIGELDACYLIYSIAKRFAFSIMKKQRRFSQFFPWARELVSFIEQLDLEDISEKSLFGIQMSAAIGYEVPQNINALLEHIIKIRSSYHSALYKKDIFSRGLMYLHASQLVGKREFNELDTIIFCNFFYLHVTELRIIKQIFKSDKGICIFQGDERDWPVLKINAKNLGSALQPKTGVCYQPKLSFYVGHDLHSQVGLVREVLKKIKGSDTVIVLPRPESLVPLLSEITSNVTDFNVSLGYPLKRSSLFALLNILFRAQETKTNSTYYAPDYLNVLRHPLVKNIRFLNNSAITRVLVHKIEEVLIGRVETELGGTLFVDLASIENLPDIYILARDTLRNMNIRVSIDELTHILKQLHSIFFHSWEKIKNFEEFSDALGELISVLLYKSMVATFLFNIKVIDRIFSIKEELALLSFSKESIELKEISSIFLQKLESEMISFVGSPLRGLQILGLFETRSLNFENVIIMDMNESVFPKLKIYEPLIPREVMLSLGLDRPEKEEEIQRYQFMRLLRGAKNVHLVYEENQVKEKSRFIEELIWAKQRQLNRLDVIQVPKASFNLKIEQPQNLIKKSLPVIDFLKKETYSASRINTYLRCPLQFYYQYVLGLSEVEDLLDEPEARELGTFIHQLLEETFKKFLNQRPLLDKDFKNNFWRRFEEKFASSIAKRMKSDSFLLKGIIEDRLKRFLDAEAERKVEKILCLEKEFVATVQLNGTSVQFISQVDRIDQYPDSSIVIIDYKTGGVDLVPKKLAQLKVMEFNRESIRDNIKSFQLPLYYYFIRKQFLLTHLNAELYSIRTLERKPFISEIDLPHEESIMDICLKALEYILNEILDPNIPFKPDKDERKCEFCPFISLCP